MRGKKNRTKSRVVDKSPTPGAIGPARDYDYERGDWRQAYFAAPDVTVEHVGATAFVGRDGRASWRKSHGDRCGVFVEIGGFIDPAGYAWILLDQKRSPQLKALQAKGLGLA